MKKISLLCISGSLKAASINLDLLKRIVNNIQDTEINVTILEQKHLDLPIFNPDSQMQQEVIDSALKSKQMIKNADVLLLASPEYNGSMTGAMKNFIDWISLDLGGGIEKNVFAGKRAAVVSASPSNFGGFKGMSDLRDVMIHMGAFIYPYTLCLSKISDYSEKQLQLINEFSTNFLQYIKK